MLANDPILEARRQWIAHGWGDVADTMAVVTSVIRLQQLLLARIDGVLKPHGLTLARFEVLMVLSFSANGMMRLGALGERLQVHPASVTNAIDRLEADKLVTRVTGFADRRKTYARITPAGRRRVDLATVDVNAAFAELDLPPSLVDDLLVARQRAGDPTATRFVDR